MSTSIEQAAANLAAARKSGRAQDAEVALASYDESLGGKEAPEPELAPAKSALDEREVAPPA